MGTQTKRIQYLYDARGHRQALIDHDGGRFTYAYDGVGRISVVQNAQGERTSYAYDPAGRRTVKLLANGTRASFAYDPAGNLTKLYNLKSDGTVISSFDYSYDKVGNRTAVLEADGSRVTWSYDATYQLTGEHRTGTGPYRDTYTYDPTGNRLLKIHDGARTTSAYDAANQLTYSQDASGRTTYTFDADGNQQRILAPNGDRTTYVWDYENRMTSVRLPSGLRNTMAYEPEGLRVKLEESTGLKKFVWDEQNYLAETDSANDTQVVYTNEPRRYGNLVSQRRLTSGVWTPHWYHFDAIGSTRELTTAGQVVSDTRLYDAWGVTMAAAEMTAFPFKYGGRIGYSVMSDPGLLHVRPRVYTPALARWLSVDPLFHSTVAAYTYVSNNPLQFIDPSGLFDERIDPPRPILGVGGVASTRHKCGPFVTSLYSLNRGVMCDRKDSYEFTWRHFLRPESVPQDAVQFWQLTERNVTFFRARPPNPDFPALGGCFAIHSQQRSGPLKDVIDLLPSSTKTGVLGKDLQREHEFRVAPNIFCMVVVDVAITIGLDDGKGRLPLAGQDDAANVLDEKELMRLRNPRNKCTFSFKYIYVDLTKCHGCQSICEDAVWLGLPEIYERLETPWGVFECPASGNARR